MLIEQVQARAGTHSRRGVPTDPEQRLYFGLLEILDWDCIPEGDAPQTLTEAGAKRFLYQRKDRIKCPLPSYLGLFAGVFDFLDD